MFTFLSEGNKKIWVITTHVLLWVAYIALMLAANKLSDPTITVAHAVLFMLPLCLVFYLSLFWLNRYKRMGVWKSLLSFIVTFLILGLITYMYMYRTLPSANIHLYTTDQIREFLKYAVLGYIQYYAYAVLYFAVSNFIKKERAFRKVQEEKLLKELENARLKEQEQKSQKEKLQTEYAFLRAQVNPHFLHNTLNTLYSQALEYSDSLASNISKLSNMMRYSFESIEYESDSVPIEKELKNLSRLIDMNQIRRSGENLVDFKIEGEIKNQMVPPLSFITIVENAFKYGDFTATGQPLFIRLFLKPRSIRFLCCNKIRSKANHSSSHQVGLQNLQKRLQALYKNNFHIIVSRRQGVYTTELIINT